MAELNENFKTVESLWKDYLNLNPSLTSTEVPMSFYFCDNEKDANECAELVLQGIKKATATSLWYFENNNEALPKVGDKFIVTDWQGIAKAIVETTKVEHVAFNKVSENFAYIEGEGDRSLSYWKKVHQDYYRREMEAFNEDFDENMIIICEQFKLIYS